MASEMGYGVAVAPDGSVVACGLFNPPISLGNGISLTSSGLNDWFIVKLAR
jgi:hypothetical protein